MNHLCHPRKFSPIYWQYIWDIQYAIDPLRLRPIRSIWQRACVYNLCYVFDDLYAYISNKLISNGYNTRQNLDSRAKYEMSVCTPEPRHIFNVLHTMRLVGVWDCRAMPQGHDSWNIIHRMHLLFRISRNPIWRSQMYTCILIWRNCG